MTALARTDRQAVVAPVDPLNVLIARSEARAYLHSAGELDLHEAVDELQRVAIRDGLIERIGQDAVQAIMSRAFGEPQHELG